mmetsp:Transcript_10830/g.37952  ORF Transcript_10830/g.37952 Transcript_10830/m.37952 type:complete len:121 (+) Transcript_10830:735-1097(+)
MNAIGGATADSQSEVASAPPSGDDKTCPDLVARSEVRTVRLHMKDGTAGLDLVTHDLGFLVEGISALPGQPGGLRVGDAILEIEGRRLGGLSQEIACKAFRDAARNGATLRVAQLVEAVE